MEKINRRNLFKLFVGAAALPLIKSLPSEKISDPIVEKWIPATGNISIRSGIKNGDFSTIVIQTLRDNNYKLMENISKNNTLLTRLSSKNKS